MLIVVQMKKTAKADASKQALFKVMRKRSVVLFACPLWYSVIYVNCHTKSLVFSFLLFDCFLFCLVNI